MKSVLRGYTRWMLADFFGTMNPAEIVLVVLGFVALLVFIVRRA